MDHNLVDSLSPIVDLLANYHSNSMIFNDPLCEIATQRHLSQNQVAPLGCNHYL